MKHLKQTIIERLGLEHFIQQLTSLDLRESRSWGLIRDYIVGTYRQKCYDSKNFRFLIRLHIKQQYRLRNSKARACVERGSCMYCGCKTPDLLFANKACGLSEVPDFSTRAIIANRTLPCYDKMLSKKEWKKKILKLSSWDLNNI